MTSVNTRIHFYLWLIKRYLPKSIFYATITFCIIKHVIGNTIFLMLIQKSVDDLFYCLVHQMEEILSNEILMLTLLVTKFLVGYVVNFNPIFLDTH